jgi:hypothetical protein
MLQFFWVLLVDGIDRPHILCITKNMDIPNCFRRNNEEGEEVIYTKDNQQFTIHRSRYIKCNCMGSYYFYCSKELVRIISSTVNNSFL